MTQMTSGIICSVLGCSNRDDGNHQSKGITFHRFPHALRETDRLRMWLLNVNRNRTIPLNKSYLCSEHFTADCFDEDGLVVKLKPDSIPTKLTSQNFEQSNARNENPGTQLELAKTSEIDTRKDGANEKQDGNQATDTTKNAFVPRTNPTNRHRLKVKTNEKKHRQRENQEAHIFKLVPGDEIDPATKSALEAEYGKERGSNGNNKRTDSQFPVSIMVMDPAMGSTTGEESGEDGLKEGGNKSDRSLRRVPVLVMDPKVRAALKARHKESNKQGGKQPVVTFWPVSAHFAGDFQQETSADTGNYQPILPHELDHPYTSRVSLQEKLEETTRKLELCQKQLIQERKRAYRLKKRLNHLHGHGIYTSIHNEPVVIKKSRSTFKKKKKKTGKAMKEVKPASSDSETMLEVSHSDLIDFSVIELPEETSSLLTQLFQVSHDDALMPDLLDSG